MRHIATAEEWEALHAEAGEKLVVVDFTATWCGPCKLIGPKFEKLAPTVPDAVFVKVDVDEGEELATEAGIEAMPTFQFFKKGQKVAQMTGSKYDELVALVTQHGGTIAPSPKRGAPGRLPRQRPDGAQRIFITGPSAGVGKSTVTVGIMAALIERGVPPRDIAYIKPVTQGIQPTLAAKFCKSKGIDHLHVGPLVFHRGFTADFLAGRTKATEELLAEIKAAVDEIATRKSVVLVDGVGYPAVGSLVGVDNADVAKQAKAAVLVVGREGLGDAVDSYNLCARYFEAKGVPVLGAVFNRVSPEEMKRTSAEVPAYFARHRSGQRVYGVLPELLDFKSSADYATPGTSSACTVPKGPVTSDMIQVSPCSEMELNLAKKLTDQFAESGFDLEQLLVDTRAAVEQLSSAASTTVAPPAAESADLLGMF